MTWALLALRFMKKNWKAIAIALVLGVLCAGIGSLWGGWKYWKGQAAMFKAERDAARTMLTSAVEVNEEWSRMAVTWKRAVDEMLVEGEDYQARLAAERSRRRVSEARILELEADISAQITATDCEGALDQLVNALGWGAP